MAIGNTGHENDTIRIRQDFYTLAQGCEWVNEPNGNYGHSKTCVRQLDTTGTTILLDAYIGYDGPDEGSQMTIEKLQLRVIAEQDGLSEVIEKSEIDLEACASGGDYESLEQLEKFDHLVQEVMTWTFSTPPL